MFIERDCKTAMLYELARTWLGLYAVGRRSCLSTVMYTVMTPINREGDGGRRLVMQVSARLTVVTFFSLLWNI